MIMEYTMRVLHDHCHRKGRRGKQGQRLQPHPYSFQPCIHSNLPVPTNLLYFVRLLCFAFSRSLCMLDPLFSFSFTFGCQGVSGS